MPLYEFRCPKCSHKFEQIVFTTDSEPVQCPKCGVPNPERLLSIFSASGASANRLASGTPLCSTSSNGFS